MVLYQANPTVSFEYIAELETYWTKRPYYVVCKPTTEIPTGNLSNIETEWHHGVPVENVRDYQESLSFEREGFIVLEHASSVGTRFHTKSMNNDLKEITEFLRTTVRAEKMRLNRTTRAHHTKEGGLRRIARYLTDEEKIQFLSSDYQCRTYNMWKPLIKVIEDNALAICNPASVDV
ncbi:hypothetical protein K505DRAFT_336689 [Melanomma pulvis-pyrius CBS 109.77]|uniref:Uncharacterized protein n=1 Tax=Melanomma pulvis-pyrius CBS 109.77 TaxID=1314802 RepID=A0A6A6XDX0_9PLEO|nr:hypothetical protein K505DRAFT_336689 [Melanomma pulvis-pyrius CBS 109.77]